MLKKGWLYPLSILWIGIPGELKIDELGITFQDENGSPTLNFAKSSIRQIWRSPVRITVTTFEGETYIFSIKYLPRWIKFLAPLYGFSYFLLKKDFEIGENWDQALKTFGYNYRRFEIVPLKLIYRIQKSMWYGIPVFVLSALIFMYLVTTLMKELPGSESSSTGTEKSISTTANTNRRDMNEEDVPASRYEITDEKTEVSSLESDFESVPVKYVSYQARIKNLSDVTTTYRITVNCVGDQGDSKEHEDNVYNLAPGNQDYISAFANLSSETQSAKCEVIRVVKVL